MSLIPDVILMLEFQSSGSAQILTTVQDYVMRGSGSISASRRLLFMSGQISE
jgi:hypothetical protein